MSEKIEMFNIDDNATKTIKVENNAIRAAVVATKTIKVENNASIMWDHPTYVEPAETHESDRGPYDGWINSVNVNGKRYAIKAAIVEYHALTCPKCGGQIHMHNGMGKCQFCDTEFSATIRLVEV